jgi:transposase InsO family protein
MAQEQSNQQAPLQSNHEAEEAVRQRAIDLFIAGKKPSQISRAVGRSRAWFYNTLARYRNGGRAGLVSRSRAPKRVSNRTAEAVEAAVVRVRQTILRGEDADLRYASIGANTIASELKRAEIEPPSRRTIQRILQRHQLVEPKAPAKAKAPIPEDYPWPRVNQANELHLFDFVTRTISGGGRFYSCNLMDQWRRWPVLRIITTKNAESVLAFLVEAWQEIGLPAALYLDNDIVWRGSGSAPRTFSRIVRLALWLGIELIFTPPYTPKANPLIESFNALWSANFWSRRLFQSVIEVQQELPHFEYVARYRHPWPQLGLRTADLVAPDFVPLCLPTNFTQHRTKSLPLTTGYLHFIRFVDLTGSFSILNEPWQLEAERWAGKTIRATLDLSQKQLLVFHQTQRHAVPTQIAQFDYVLDEKLVPLQDCYRRPRPTFWPSNS